MAVTVALDLTIPHPRYVRRGECGRCGECCINEDCKHFEFDGKIASCKIYESPDLPLRCRLFPEAPPILFKKCRYYFLDTWENNRRVEAGEI